MHANLDTSWTVLSLSTTCKKGFVCSEIIILHLSDGNSILHLQTLISLGKNSIYCS